MRRLLILLLVAAVTFGIVIYVRRPDLFEDAWIWLVGLTGPIVQLARSIWAWIKESITGKETPAPATAPAGRVSSLPPVGGLRPEAVLRNRRSNTPGTVTARPVSVVNPMVTATVPVSNSQPVTGTGSQPAGGASLVETGGDVVNPGAGPEMENAILDALGTASSAASNVRDYLLHPPQRIGVDPSFDGTTISVIRHSADRDTTVGFVYIDGSFTCYSLEDAPREKFRRRKTRIPAGNYQLDFLEEKNAFTRKYRRKFDWFSNHLELKEVDKFENICFHIGTDHKDTEGSILLIGQLNLGAHKEHVTSSEQAFQSFYQRIRKDLEHRLPVQVVIRDEQWFAQNFS